MGIVDFIASAKGKRVTGTAYGIGASIVILGALFKIQHWTGAGLMLSVGMITEAILFALSSLEKPHKEFEWDIVFPQLAGHDGTVDPEDLDTYLKEHPAPQPTPPLGSISGVAGGGGVATIGGVTMSSVSEGDLQKLSSGIKALSDTASQLSDLSSAAAATNGYVKSMTNASASIDEFSKNQLENMSKATASVEAFTKSQLEVKGAVDTMLQSYQNVSEGLTGSFKSSAGVVSQLENMTKNLASINSVYEIHLKSVADQNATIQSVTAELDKVKASVNVSATESEAYKVQSVKLTQQITSLNGIYGNMLNALNIKS